MLKCLLEQFITELHAAQKFSTTCSATQYEYDRVDYDFNKLWWRVKEILYRIQQQIQQQYTAIKVYDHQKYMNNKQREAMLLRHCQQDSFEWNYVSTLCVKNIYGMNVQQLEVRTGNRNAWLLQVDSTSTTNFLGFTVASFGLAQCIGSLLFGWWADYFKSVKRALIYSAGLTLIGNLVYFSADFVPNNGRWVVMAGRFFIGLGAGEYGLMLRIVQSRLEFAFFPPWLCRKSTLQRSTIPAGVTENNMLFSLNRNLWVFVCTFYRALPVV